MEKTESFTFLPQNVIKESEGVLDMVKEVEFDVNKTAISVASCRNSLQALSDTQFIENKIEEIEEVENTSESIEVCESMNFIVGTCKFILFVVSYGLEDF